MIAASSRHAPADPRWRFWIDTGGTFTDCIALDPFGAVHRLKLLSSSRLRGVVSAVAGPTRARLAFPREVPEDFLRGLELRALGEDRWCAIARSTPEAGTSQQLVTLAEPLFEPAWIDRLVEIRFAEEAPVVAVRLITGSAPGRTLPPLELRLATTRGTNALLERRGARVAFFVTRGFRDLIAIGTQARPELFVLDIEKPPPLYERVVEVAERLDATGAVLEPIDLASVERAADELVREGVTSAAVALLHSYRDPVHERATEAALLRAGFSHVASSAAMAPVIRILPRAETAVVDAYLGPIVDRYLRSIRRSLDAPSSVVADRQRVLVMTSAGGLVPDDACRAKDCLLSGPAGGVVGAAAAALATGHRAVLSFDMGGTSTDVARFAGELEYVFEQRVGDARIVAPALHIETVAAGGGSVCWSSDGQLKVGPHSAGADPGPACYGAGGPLTLTDVNLLLGRLDVERFEVPLAPEAAEIAAAAVARSARIEPERVPEMLEGFLQIANERMAEAIRRVSVQRGYDPAEHALLAFGGAGAQHACAIAAELGISTVIVPADVSLLSAVGLGRAALERFAHRQVLERLATLPGGGLRSLLESTAAEARALVQRDAPFADAAVRRRIARLRFVGQESTLDVDCAADEDADALAGRFVDQYRVTFGTAPEREIELESLRVVAAAHDRIADRPVMRRAPRVGGAPRTAPARFAGRLLVAPVVERASLERDSPIEGPALLVERRSCTVVEPGWRARAHASGSVLLERRSGGD